jgi:hypothetical protein
MYLTSFLTLNSIGEKQQMSLNIQSKKVYKIFYFAKKQANKDYAYLVLLFLIEITRTFLENV